MVSLGINYFRRRRDEFGGVLWQLQPRQMREDERKEYGIQPGQLAAICKGIKRTDMQDLLRQGFKTNDVWDMAGATGIGTAGQGEYAKNGRPPIWTAFKRAEIDLYRQLFPMLSRVPEAVNVAPSSPRITSLDNVDINELLFGDTPKQPEVDYDAPIPGEYTEIIQVEEEPFDWRKSALEADSLDALAYALYQIYPSEAIFKNATAVKNFVLFVAGSPDNVRNADMLDAAAEYVLLLEDGIIKRDAADSAKSHYNNPPPPEQIAMFDDKPITPNGYDQED